MVYLSPTPPTQNKPIIDYYRRGRNLGTICNQSEAALLFAPAPQRSGVPSCRAWEEHYLREYKRHSPGHRIRHPASLRQRRLSSHLGNRTPLAKRNLSTRSGSSQHSPSTSCSSLIAATTDLRRARYCSTVSSHGLVGLQRRSFTRIRVTAVSWSISSCKAPGCSGASSPMKARRPLSRRPCLNPRRDVAGTWVVEAGHAVDE